MRWDELTEEQDARFAQVSVSSTEAYIGWLSVRELNGTPIPLLISSITGEKLVFDDHREVKLIGEKSMSSYAEAVRKYNTDDISTIVSKDAETVTNEAGGSQSHVPVRFDLIDAKALFEQAKVLHEGAVKYGENNWRLISVEDHLNHLIMHAYAYLSGDRSDEHLSHIMCRATFAQGVVIGDAENYKKEGINE